MTTFLPRKIVEKFFFGQGTTIFDRGGGGGGWLVFYGMWAGERVGRAAERVLLRLHNILLRKQVIRSNVKKDIEKCPLIIV